MSQRSQFMLALTPAIALALSAALWAAPPEKLSSPKAQLATYEKASGEKSFALSLMPLQKSVPADAHDIMVLLDTSASQNGPYREGALQALNVLLANLDPKDRVKIFAVDLDATAMNRKFVAPDSMQMKIALKKLERRLPLGSTDMAKTLQAAVDGFDSESKNPRSVIYIGDGVSNANWIATGKFADLVQALVKNRIPVSSFAVGPNRNIPLLAALANQTGGMLLMDGNGDHAAENAGVSMSHIVRGTVYWPVDSKFPKAMQEVFPKTVPPLRSDRDTILIGTLDGTGSQQISVSTESGGNQVEMVWKVTPVRAGDDLGFLPRLLDIARKDHGMSLPTVGTAGLREVGRTMLSGARELSELGGRALALGDRAGAKNLADAALARDPSNPQALALSNASKNGANGVNGNSDLRLVNAPAGDEEPGSFLREFEEGNPGEFLDSYDDQSKAIESKVIAEVEEGLKNARAVMVDDAERAKDELLRLWESVKGVVELEHGTRTRLHSKIESALKEASRRSVVDDVRRRETEESIAAARERASLVEAATRKSEKIKQLTDRFNSLMAEERYLEAGEQVATQMREIDRTASAPEAMVWNARFGGNTSKILQLREIRHRNFVDALYRAEAAHVPFPDEPPIIYPDAEVWEELTLRRKKYSSVDLSKPGSAEEKIFAALDQDASFEFFDRTLADVVEFLEEQHDINIELHMAELEAVGKGSDTPVTRSLSGISLRSALRLLLRDLELTYIVKDEVLQITTTDFAETQLVTKVYPVGDLVLPISSQAGANPFQLGGGLGGQGGFGGGLGGGMMGGGMMGGGMMGGGMMGGGFFAVDDDLSLGTKKSSTPRSQAPPVVKRRVQQSSVSTRPRRIQVNIETGMSAHDAWNKFFSSRPTTKTLRADVRETTRQLWREKKYPEIVAMLQAALRQGQPQPWIYEAMVAAQQAQDAPRKEIERALMSAVDFSDNANDMLFVAAYMASLEFDERALQLFRSVSSVYPHRPEPYIQGLQVAKRLQDQDGIQWACVGILSQAWPKEHRHIEKQAFRTAFATLEQLRKEQRNQQADKLEAALNRSRIRDCVVRVSWTGDADVDVLVEGPDGTVCSFRNPRTVGGGVMLGDTFSSPQNATINGYSETYECPQGFSGTYRVLLRRVWGKVTAGKVTIDIYTNRKTKKEKHIHKQIDLGEKDALVIFDVNNGRRTQPLEEQQIANVARTQQAISRAVLMQQLYTVSNSRAVADYEVQRRKAIKDGRLRPRHRPGFRPVITTLPEGTNMTATAVVSADRRYVRITATPLFSLIGQVNTFNFQTGMDMGGMDGGMDGGGADGGGADGGGG